MAKTLSFGAMHLIIAFSIGYALTGDVAISGAIALVEPIANTVAFHFFERHWPRLRRLRPLRRLRFGGVALKTTG